MDRNTLKFGVVIFVFLLLLFLYNKMRNYSDYLVVVPNSLVTTKVRPKTRYRFNFVDISWSSGFDPTNPVVTTTDYTTKNCTNNPLPLECPVISGISSGINGSSKTLHIYNPSISSFKIIGTTLQVTSNAYLFTKVAMTIGSRTLPKPYKGDKIDIPIEQEIKFINLDEYILNRITIICDNVIDKSLYIYITNTSSNVTGGFRINNLTNNILIIDLYNSN